MIHTRCQGLTFVSSFIVGSAAADVRGAYVELLILTDKLTNLLSRHRAIHSLHTIIKADYFVHLLDPEAHTINTFFDLLYGLISTHGRVTRCVLCLKHRFNDLNIHQIIVNYEHFWLF